ncbi:MAG TPA: mannose-1-phosphate guanylyltransferase/mannose-6-phosphate isomerase, partial [Candidatus Omnitrophica bacterium]|nr:mannose-1-phosphate guanylyltransferase/mannose-6-phosphate isomerase [Candidatus Omnitrophota bacterium]
MKIAILAGGSGTRLWPMSRPTYPKQFIRLNSEYSFFQSTILRCLNGFKMQDLIISAHQDYKFHVISDIIKISPSNKLPDLIFEPEMKNTYGALLGILNFSLNRLKLDRREVIALLPSDHMIDPADKFNAVLKSVEKYARKGQIVIFGIEARCANTGYGYIKTKRAEGEALEVEGFIEKPSKDRAEQLVSEKGCFWNSGMFCFEIKTMIDEIKKHMPDTAGYLGIDFEDFIDRFKELPAISIDNAVIEKTDKLCLISMPDLNWSDIGSFEALYEIMDKDSAQNVFLGDVVAEDTRGSFLSGRKRLIAAIGLQDMLVIETEDAILICPRSESQRVKDLVLRMKSENRKQAFEHATHYRPWGSFSILEEDRDYKIKHVFVNPKERLSLQLHNRRSEHWVVIKGKAKVTIGEKKLMVKENESIYVPCNTKHSLENPQDD